MGVRRATSLADRLGAGVCIAVLHGECKEDERNDDDGRASPPPNDEQVIICIYDAITDHGTSL